jgi:hypothetical protein
VVAAAAAAVPLALPPPAVSPKLGFVSLYATIGWDNIGLLFVFWRAL